MVHIAFILAPDAYPTNLLIDKTMISVRALYSESSKYADGKCLACTYRAKFVEVSVGINHNVDELLVGTLTQIRLKKEQNPTQVSDNLLCAVLR